MMVLKQLLYFKHAPRIDQIQKFKHERWLMSKNLKALIEVYPIDSNVLHGSCIHPLTPNYTLAAYARTPMHTRTLTRTHAHAQLQ
jgi:hypothetical protein